MFGFVTCHDKKIFKNLNDSWSTVKDFLKSSKMETEMIQEPCVTEFF